MKATSLGLIGLVCVICGAINADAGVRGKSFAGTVRVALDGEVVNTGTIQLTFAENSNYVLAQNFGTVEAFQGTFTEFDLLVVSFWHGTVLDGSPDHKGEQYGISLLGFVTTFLGVQPDINPGLLATGVFFQTTSPTRNTPAKPDSIVGQ